MKLLYAEGVNSNMGKGWGGGGGGRRKGGGSRPVYADFNFSLFSSQHISLHHKLEDNSAALDVASWFPLGLRISKSLAFFFGGGVGVCHVLLD